MQSSDFRSLVSPVLTRLDGRFARLPVRRYAGGGAIADTAEQLRLTGAAGGNAATGSGTGSPGTGTGPGGPNGIGNVSVGGALSAMGGVTPATVASALSMMGVPALGPVATIGNTLNAMQSMGLLGPPSLNPANVAMGLASIASQG